MYNMMQTFLPPLNKYTHTAVLFPLNHIYTKLPHKYYKNYSENTLDLHTLLSFALKSATVTFDLAKPNEVRLLRQIDREIATNLLCCQNHPAEEIGWVIDFNLFKKPNEIAKEVEELSNKHTQTLLNFQQKDLPQYILQCTTNTR
jgi:hypothetical protein